MSFLVLWRIVLLHKTSIKRTVAFRDYDEQKF
jgi:hypothetical protein